MTIKDDIRVLIDAHENARRVRADLQVQAQQLAEQLDEARLAEQTASQALLARIREFVSS